MKCSEIEIGGVYQDAHQRAVRVLKVGVPYQSYGSRRVTNSGVRAVRIYEKGYGDIPADKQVEQTIASCDLTPMPEGGVEAWKKEAADRKERSQCEGQLRAAMYELGFVVVDQGGSYQVALRATTANLARANELLATVRKS